MATGKYNIVILQGATYSRTINWKDVEQDPIDITDYTARMHIRPELESSDILLQLTTENGRIEITDPENGQFRIQLTAAETDELDFEDAVYDLELVAPGGEPVFRLLRGKARVSLQITRESEVE